ncbi:methyl-accepting chemotaxis protein [Paractinoplanes brasiliensis]|uniref:Methyl-accepting chemotaxis protein n=1 Tax=Paractinoplanes brasiliensis TaxID=52695 RepID=A0A4R6JLV5_9ACTN|nr:methyl-accepting chemotaxis protein [Actinoplanes brasiliensis]TDO37353.1 methyl-accepting chemotaxis protein [Actinoplanes brasiliensis]GID29330.1 chemotaxis protein [Actinoplanes brasiliensis]
MSPRFKRLLTDRRVSTKIMAAVGVVSLLGVGNGLYALSSLGTINKEVEHGVENSQELDTLGSLRSAVNRSWLGVSDHMLAGTPAERAAATKAITEAEADVVKLSKEFQAHAVNSDALATAKRFDKNWTEFTRLVSDEILPLSERNAQAELNTLRDGVLAREKEDVRAILASLSETTVKASEEQAAAAQATYESTRTLVISSLAASLLLGLALALAISRMIVKPLARNVEALERIAQGDLTARVEVDSADEVGQMSETLNRTAVAMSEMVERIQNSSTVLASASEELSAVSSELSASAEETSAQVNTVSESAARVSTSVTTVSAGAEEMGVSIREISNNANEAASVAADAARAAETTNASVARLVTASGQIGSVVALITSIAEQTNLLALNATIEAARAGEAGKGFAVVASEVKDLAQETARATQEITNQVGAIQAESNAAVIAIQQIGEVIETINDYTTTIAAAVEEQTATTAEISRSVHEAAMGSSSIADTIAGVSEAAAHVTSGASDTQQTATSLARTAAELQATVSVYRLS